MSGIQPRSSIMSANASMTGTVSGKQDANESNYNELDDANMSDDEEGGTRIGGIYIPPPIPPYCSTESKGPRLIISKIENNNFKSYAGTVVLGPFHHCFTAIIGPNGSGKSNVIDSMLFVFGYRANKIRCKKLSTLIHNSAKFPNMPSCSVTVYFKEIIDRPDGTCDDVPNSDICITRTAFRDNSSFYAINGKKSQFKMVTKILKQHNIDVDHNRFLILQGEVESIAMMKPKGLTENECGMLEYLEDIVGTTRYIEPLKKISQREMELTEERTEKHNRCMLAEREMNDLEEPYNEAIRFLRLENENTRLKNIRIQKYLNEKKRALEEYNVEIEKINEELREHDVAHDAIKAEREKKEAQIQNELKHFETLRLKKEEIEKKLQKAKSDYAEVQQLMTETNKRRKDYKAQLKKHEEELVDLKKVPEKNLDEIMECEKKVEKLNTQKAKAEEELQENYIKLENETKPLIERREKLDTQLIELKNHVDVAQRELKLSEAELKILKHDETTEMRKYETMKTAYEESQSTLEEKRKQLAEAIDLKPQLEKELIKNSALLQKLQREEEIMQAKLRNLKAEINEKTATMQMSHSNNKVLNFLMKLKNEGRIPGILGRLGDLGGIDSKFDVAISTACGRLDNIVVETVNTAQECIEQLKRFDVGRASFIALEKVKYLESHSGKIRTPENAPRLYDLVRVEDERVLPAFYFALRNTLVASDLDQGTRIAYGERRFRVVTLNGDVIETSGTMSGGGRTQIRGKMGTKVQTKTKYSADASLMSQKALEDMQVQAEEIQSQINYNQEEQGRLEKETKQLKQKLQLTEGEVQKLNISVKSLMEQLPRIFKQLESQKQRAQKTKTDTGKVQTLEKEIEMKKAQLAKSEEAANKVMKQTNDIKEQIEHIHGDKVKTVQTKINNLNNQIKKLNGNISKLKVDITTSERNVAKLEKQIDHLQSEIIKAQNDITELGTNREKHDQETTEYTAELEKAAQAIEDARSDSSSVQQEVKALGERENASKLKRVEIEQRLKEKQSLAADVTSQIPHWTAQLKPLKLNEIPGEPPQAPLKMYTQQELDSYNLQDIQYKESVQEELLNNKPRLTAIKEYIEKRDIYLERVKVLEDITSKRNEMRQLYDDVRKKRYNEFMQGFHIITRKLKEMYQMITQGGDAELELCDSMDPFREGITFSVRPPKKSWKNISNLSGGEKTLSSLALVFALHYYKPSPLYFMDEIDAALDFKNISIVAHYIKERTKNAQFIIISLRSNMFELSDLLVGIYKVDDCTDSLAIVNEDTYVTSSSISSTNKEMANDENGNDKSPQIASEKSIRDSTFLPPSESTALSQNLPLAEDSAVMETNTTNVTAADVFKKPLPAS